MLFQVIGTNFAGPIYYRTKTKKESKAYILMFSCSVSRAVNLELILNTTTQEFIKCTKRLIARRGKPSTIYSDKAKFFQGEEISGNLTCQKQRDREDILKD